MDILALLRRLWPFLKPEVVAAVAAELKKLAARRQVPITNEAAVALAAFIVDQLEALLDRDDADPVLVKAVAAFARSAVEPAAPVAAIVPKKRKR